MSSVPNVADASIPGILGAPGGKIRINSNIDWYNDTREEKVYILVHEFGHILGLSHTDYVSNYNNCPVGHDYDDPIENLHIYGTPLTQAQSVMDSHSAGRSAGNASSWSGFTLGDLAAIQAIYGTPIWSQSITGPAMWHPTCPTPYTLNLDTNLINLDVSWYVDGSLKQTGTSLTFSPNISTSGQATIKAVVNYGGVNYEASQTINVYAPYIGGSANDPGVNSNVEYSVQPYLISGVTFNNWSITGGSYTITSDGTNNPSSLKIRFASQTTYTLRANFTVNATGASFHIERNVSILPSAPTIVADNYSPPYWIPNRGMGISFHIEPPYPVQIPGQQLHRMDRQQWNIRIGKRDNVSLVCPPL